MVIASSVEVAYLMGLLQRCRMAVWAAVLLFAAPGHPADPYTPSEITKIAFLGTGNPNADPEHSGPSVAIIVNATPYIIDFGPGVVRQAAALSTEYGGPLAGFDVATITRAFLTHLHSDHTIGYPDLILTPWVLGREEPLQVYGPKGIQEMTDHILQAYTEDIKMRLYGKEEANNLGWRVEAHEIDEGTIYKDKNITVDAFLVKHGSWPQAFGLKITTPDRTVCVSGDARPSENLIESCQGVDILVHEVYSQKGFESRDEHWQGYHVSFHTSSLELAEIGSKVKPKLLILYHQLYWGTTDDDLLEEVRSKYDGEVVSAKDLDIY
jgi:ribonuclease Z